MSFHGKFVRELKRLGVNVIVDKHAETRGRQWSDGAPRAFMVHHTAGAASTSKNPETPANSRNANAGIEAWVRHASSPYPWANATLHRDGTLVIHSTRSAWHSGLGSFRNTRWARLGIGDNSAHLQTWGLEVVSKGLKPDFTPIQHEVIHKTAVAMKRAAGWKGYLYRIVNHKDWAPRRKNDTLYPWEEFVSGARTIDKQYPVK